MKTCFNTITAGADKLLEDVIRECGRAGFDAVEIDADMLASSLTRMSLDALRLRLDEAHLAVASLMAFNLEVFDDPTGDLDQICQAAEWARELNAPMLLTYCAADVPQDTSKEEAVRQAADRVALYADTAAPISIALEPIGRRTLMSGPRDALEIARLSGRDNVGIMMDTFHYYLSRVQAEDILAIPRENLLIVHINDAEDVPIDELNDDKRLHVGQGILPLEEDVHLWREIGYDGYVSIEIFRPEYWAQPVEKVVREGKRSLDRLFAVAAES